MTGTARRRWVLERLAHRLLHFLVLAGLLLMVAVVIVPLAKSDRPGYEAPLLTAVPLVIVAQVMSSRVSRLVDWLLYGLRDDPSSATWHVARELETATADQTLPTMLAAMGSALRLSYAEVRIGPPDDEQVAATYGNPGDGGTSLELRHAGRHLGTLVASRRGQVLAPEDDQVLRVLAAQLAVVVHAQRLNRDLQQAREGLVLSREAERRRLRRDLHDGVGPALAGIALGVETIDAAMAQEPDRASVLLAEVRAEIGEVISDVRRAVDGLRPPMLDEVGLGPAVEQIARSFAERSGVGLTLDLCAPGRLPAAVEVGAYRIAVEALTNAARHARATSWSVGMRVHDQALHVVVRDDGVGTAGTVPGHGFASLSERAGELGGEVEITSGAEGTCVVARIPCGSEA